MLFELLASTFVGNLCICNASHSGSFHDQGHCIAQLHFQHLFIGRTYGVL